MDRANVNVPPARPLIVFDGDCNFCRYWIARWRQITGDRIDYLPFQDKRISESFPELPVSRFEKAVQLIDTDGTVYGGAEAAFRALAPDLAWPLWAYQHVPGVRTATELFYGAVARNRALFSFLTRLLWGTDAAPASYLGVRWLFLRLVGLVYVIAFVSLGLQIVGLIGHNGIVPADQVMVSFKRNTQDLGWTRLLAYPTACWFRTDDHFLRLQCVVGAVLGLFVMCGIAQKLSLFVLWALYLSLSVICNVFLGFQWDILLLETGLLAIIFAPAGLRASAHWNSPVSTTGLWLVRWLLFRLMFASACVKLLSGDPTWRDLTALNYHYETQPLPTWIGWYAHHLPAWWQKASTITMYAIELLAPFFIFLPRRPRLWAAGLMVGFQLCIGASGNYGFFNLLAIVLCVVLVDDAFLVRIAPRPWRSPLAARLEQRGGPTASRRVSPQSRVFRYFGTAVKVMVVLVILIVSSMLLVSMFRIRVPWPRPLIALYSAVSPFRSINNYGLFAVMTTTRPEIIVEGSNDGQNWKAYEFKWKPGRLDRRPGFVEPHQPRLDWQMWFAALGEYQQNPWFINFCFRLLEGSPDVTQLLETNPFPNAPPRYIRASVYDYRFATNSERVREGKWWRREYQRPYCPTLTLRAAGPDHTPVLEIVP